MKIAILTLGTRGDVQPYAVLGQGLQQRGHEVTLATARNFEKLVRSYGIGFVRVDADFQAVLDSDEGKKMMKANPLAVQRNLKKWVYPLIKNSLTEFYTLALRSDKVVYHVKTLADCFADQFPEKMVRASVIPMVEPTKVFPNPALSGLPIPKFLQRDEFAIMFGDNPQTSGATVLGIGLFVKGEGFFQIYFLPKDCILDYQRMTIETESFLSVRFFTEKPTYFIQCINATVP